MKRQLAVAILLVVFAGLAPTAEGAELFLPSYQWTEKLEWGPAVLKAEPVIFNLEAIRPREQGPYRIHALALSASKKLSFLVDGIEHHLVIDRVEEHGEGNFSSFGKVEGARSLSHFAVVGAAVDGEIWTP